MSPHPQIDDGASKMRGCVGACGCLRILTVVKVTKKFGLGRQGEERIATYSVSGLTAPGCRGLNGGHFLSLSFGLRAWEAWEDLSITQ